VQEIDFVAVGDDLGPGTEPVRTYDVVPHAQGVDFDDGGWRELAPAETMLRLGPGRVAFNWYRTQVTLPARIGDTDVTGATVVFEVQVDDYAEVWVDGELPLALGRAGGPYASGFNVANRVVLTDDARQGQTFTVAVFGINGPISASPRNYIWMRTATLDVYAAGRATSAVAVPLGIDAAAGALDDVLPLRPRLERVAGGFEFTEGPVWAPEGALLFSSPNTNSIYRWSPEGRVDLVRPKSGYSDVDIGRYHQPGSNGLAYDPQGRLAICQHGNRRVIRVNPHGDTTVLADRYEGARLNSPNDLVFASDGTLFFTDPFFGLPGMTDDPGRELDFAGVYALAPGGGEPTLIDGSLTGPNGIALSPDERWLYVGNWDPAHTVVMRYPLGPSGPSVSAGREVFCDLTGEPGEDSIDGIKVDADGRLYVCGPGGVWILSAQGEPLGLLTFPESPHNLAWGDADRRTLYVTALTSVYRLRLQVVGAGLRP
jgi:gluconolactonase